MKNPKKKRKSQPPNFCCRFLPTVPDADWNDEIAQDLKPEDLSGLVVHSRDWTIETINNQIAQENIDLNPKFQRRNAWNERSPKQTDRIINRWLASSRNCLGGES